MIQENNYRSLPEPSSYNSTQSINVHYWNYTCHLLIDFSSQLDYSLEPEILEQLGKCFLAIWFLANPSWMHMKSPALDERSHSKHWSHSPLGFLCFLVYLFTVHLLFVCCSCKARIKHLLLTALDSQRSKGMAEDWLFVYAADSKMLLVINTVQSLSWIW